MEKDEHVVVAPGGMIRITSKGEFFGLQLNLPVLQFLAYFIKKYPDASLRDAIKDVNRVLSRGLRRAKANEDKTLDEKYFEELDWMKKRVEHLNTNVIPKL